MAMKCPNCGTENPEGKAFCGDCGATLPQPPPPPPVQPMQYAPAQYAPIQKKPDWLESNWKGLVGVVVVLVILAGGLGLVYSQPWSKIKVLVAYNGHGQIGVNVYIDSVLKASIGLNPSSGHQIVGVWPVVAGSHSVSIDMGAWTYHPGYTSIFGTVLAHWDYAGPDGTMNFSYVWEVGALSTKNAFIQF